MPISPRFFLIALVSCFLAIFPSPSTTSFALRARTYDKIRGVNIGGVFVIEPWMKPSLIQQAVQVSGTKNAPVDQWTFMTAFSSQSQALSVLKQHWSTWIVESDYKQIKALGLNTVRIPVGHWTFNGSTSEPYAAGAELPYISQHLLWAQKYGLDVILDMHTAPNSQNGFESSGIQGPINFRSVNGPLNAARLNSALTSMVQVFVNDAKYKGVVKYVEILNEPLCSVLGADYMTGIFYSAARAVNAAISSKAVVKPQIIFHDCFITPLSNWSPAVSKGGGLANVAFSLDTHRYHVFDADRTNLTWDQHLSLARQDGQEIASATSTLKRQILTGEFSLGISCTDCGQFNTPALSAQANRKFFETQTKAYEQGAGWVFYSWLVENDLPWSYKDAVNSQWIPTNAADKSQAA